MNWQAAINWFRLRFSQILGLGTVALYKALPNLFCAIIVAMVFISADYFYCTYVNGDYAFYLNRLKPAYTSKFVLIIFLMLSSPWILRCVFISVLAAITTVQHLNFEYYGTYIRPLHYIEIWPDFLLVARSFGESLNDMTAVFAIAAFIFSSLFLLSLLFKGRLSSTWLAPLALGLLLAFSALETHHLLNPKSGKITGRTTSTVLPKVYRLASDNAFRSFKYLVLGLLPHRSSNNFRAFPQLEKPDVRSKTIDANIVLVIGETLRASQLSLLGYDKHETTPKLAKIPGLFAHSIFSAATMTRTSFAGILNRLKYPGMGKQYLSQSNCLFRLAKENGFMTHFIYGYGTSSARTLTPFMCANYIDHLRTASHAPRNFRKYDLNLMYELERVDFSVANFIVVGNRGSHTPYKRKSPKNFKKFPSEYDNSVLYTDAVLSKIIAKLKEKSKKPTYVIITSDHGELLKGESDRRGHGWFRNDVFRVPFLFLQINGNDPEISTQAQRVYSHFDLSTLVISLLGYDVKVDDSAIRDVYINGSDLNGLAGVLKLTLKDGLIASQEKIGIVETNKKSPLLKRQPLRQR